MNPVAARIARWSVIALLASGLSACVTDYRVAAGTGRMGGVVAVARGLSNAALARLTADMDPAMLALARRHDPIATADPWGRVVGWTSYDLSRIPTLGQIDLSSGDAMLINALRPFGSEPPLPARPFFLKASDDDRVRAEECLTQAIYYEAAVEPVEGMRAVAQTVLNRLRHPGYPKSVCGVVYEGSQRVTGCQFSFTCDGALARIPNRLFWLRAEAVARGALAGYVHAPVGLATHYHTIAVHPYWADSLNFIGTIGAHRFYRFGGPAGAPATFNTAAYTGGEPVAAPRPRLADGNAPDLDPVAIERAFAQGHTAASSPPTAGTPVRALAAPAYSAALQARGGDALYTAKALPEASGIRPEYANSGQWISRPGS